MSILATSRTVLDVCLRWVVEQQATPQGDRRAELHVLKNTAYAWRQALYFLSLLDPAAHVEAAAQLRAAADAHRGAWRARFEPAIVGLEAIIAGATFDATGRVDGGRRFLGWSIGPHWLASPRAPERPT